MSHLDMAKTTHHALDPNLAAVEVGHRAGEAVCLRERPDDLNEQERIWLSRQDAKHVDWTHPDFVPENLGWGPVHSRCVLIHTVNHEGTPATDVVDRIVRELLDARRLNLYRIVFEHRRHCCARTRPRTTTSNPYGLSFFSCSHCGPGFCRSSSMYSSAQSSCFAMSILMPLFAASVTLCAPFSLSSCARINPVGPAPSNSTSIPTGGFNLSSP